MKYVFLMTYFVELMTYLNSICGLEQAQPLSKSIVLRIPKFEDIGDMSHMIILFERLEKPCHIVLIQF